MTQQEFDQVFNTDVKGISLMKCPTCNIASFDFDGPAGPNSNGGPSTGSQGKRGGVVGVSKPSAVKKESRNQDEDADHLRSYQVMQERKALMRMSIRENNAQKDKMKKIDAMKKRMEYFELGLVDEGLKLGDFAKVVDKRRKGK